MKVESKQRICYVIPAYNEASVIGGVVSDLKRAATKHGQAFEIVVVDDGSKDSTAETAQTAGALVVRHILNSGSGGATATGLSYAQQHGFNIAATLDADGQHASADVIKGIDLMSEGGVDLLIGSRLMNTDGMSKVKVLGNRGLSFVTYLIFGINITDSQSGMRIFSHQALEQLKWRTAGYEFCSEMLWRAKQQKLVIKEYPIKAIYTDYSKSKGQNNWNAFNIIKSLLQQRILEAFGE
jgi:glycosyltransferase involved in cell wall biosynthesis